VPSPTYLPLSAHLPPVYQESGSSFAQLDAYLGLADDINRAYVERLEELATWLSPDALALWPADLPVTAGADAVLARYVAVYDELARWFAFRFPPGWGADADSLERRRVFVSHASRMWRRRGTPRGFVEWFSFAFGLDRAERPYLLEHFKFGRPVSAGDDVGPEPWLRATLLVQATERFDDLSARRDAILFAARYAPAHVHVRVCWVRPGFTLDPVPGVNATTAEKDTYRERIRGLLCSLVSFVDHEHGIRVWECIDEGRAIDRLGVGRLPSDSEPVHE
jgi:hypothetical protein